MKEKSKRSSFVGFTLVELVIVIAVIAILAAVLIPTFSSVISSANNSADLQLVTNMNELLAINLDEDIAASVDNIRKYLGDNGINDIATKNKNMVIAYNKGSKKFERINVSKTLDGTELVTIASADEPDGRFEAAPYTMEEIFKGNVIVSTRGNDLAEAIYALHNISSSETDKAAYITKQMKKLSGYEGVAEKVADVINKTLFIDDKGEPMQFYIGGNDKNWSVSESSTVSPDRVVFNEDCTTVYLDKLVEGNYSDLIFVLPDNVENIEVSSESKDETELLQELAKKDNKFAGNVEALHNIIEEAVEKLEEGAENPYEGLEWNGTLQEIKDAAEEGLANQAAHSEFYVSANAPEGTTEYYYQTVSAAITEAKRAANYSHNEKKVILTDTSTPINEDIVIPQNVSLEIPFYSSGSEFYTGVGYGGATDDPSINRFTSEKSIVDDDLKENGQITDKYKIAANYKQFTVTLNGNIEINGGSLVVGGVTSHYDQYYQGHTSGYYAQIDIASGKNIAINNGGKLYSYGYIKGKDGGVIANQGGSVYQPFIVTDFSGGSNSLALFNQDQSPFLRYAMLNIQSSLTVNYGALIYAHCNLITGSTYYNITDQVVIGYGDKNSPTKGLITLEEGSSAVCTYKYDKATAARDDADGNNLKGDIGKTAITIHGDARTEALSFLGLASTSVVLFPVPFNFDFIIDSGNMSIYNHYVLLPGSSVTVNEGATLTVTENSTFYVMDYLKQGAGMSGGKLYPTAAQLGEGQTSAIFTVNGSFKAEDGAKIGGIIRTSAITATLDIGNVDISGEYNIGGVGAYAANTSTYKFPLRVFDVDSIDMADYKNSDEKSTLKPANVAPNSKYASQNASSGQELSDTTEVSYYKTHEEKDTEDIVVAAGQQYVNKKEPVTIAFNATVGFKQTEGFEEQAKAFKDKKYSKDGKDIIADDKGTVFDKAEKAIDDYYALSPRARTAVSDTFTISAYDEELVSGLFKSVEEYKAAFETSEKSVIAIALATTNAWSKLQSLSANVSKLIDSGTKATLSTLHSKDENIVLFSVEFPATNKTTFGSDNKAYLDTFSVISGGEQESIQVSTANYTIDGNKDGVPTTTVYFVKSQVPEAKEIIGWYNHDNSSSTPNIQKTLGATDPVGTLFFEAWKNYVSNVTKVEGSENKVTFDIYSDMNLLCTLPYYDAQEGGSSSSFYQSLSVTEGNDVEINLNGNNLTFYFTHGFNTKLSYKAFISSVGNLYLHDGKIDTLYNELNDNAAPNFVSEKDCIIASYNKKLRLENLTIEATLGKDSKGNNRNLQFEAGVKIGARSSREGGGNGDANITNVNIIGGSNGVLIDGGYAKLDGLRATDGSTGLQINSTAEPTAEKCVEIINCDLSGRYPLRLIGKESGKSISIKRIEDCRMTVLASAAQGNAIEMSYGDNFKDSFNIMVKSIKDCIFASPAVALWASCNSTDQKIAINSIQGCTFVGDNSLTLAGVYTNAFGIKIEKNVEIGELKDCFIVATGLVNTQSIYGNCTATAVYVGSGCKVNMVYEAAAYADGRGNRFGASSENKATWFDIQSGGEVTMNGSGFDESVNLSSDTEMHNGYSCRKLQSGN